jgi:hypothetical protein
MSSLITDSSENKEIHDQLYVDPTIPCRVVIPNISYDIWSIAEHALSSQKHMVNTKVLIGQFIQNILIQNVCMVIYYDYILTKTSNGFSRQLSIWLTNPLYTYDYIMYK